MKQTLKVVSGLVAILAVAWLGLDFWGRGRLADYEETWHKDIAAERERVKGLRMPVLRGEAIEENAVVRYRPLLKRIYDPADATKGDPAVLAHAISAGIAGPVPPDVQSKLEASRPALAELAEALRCNRADWETQWERGWEAEIPSMAGARMLAQLTLLEGAEEVHAGALKAAAEHDLDTMRFGSDFATSGALIMDLLGIAIHGMGTEALSALVTSQKPENLPLAQIEAELAKLDPAVPTVVDGLRGERLSWGFLTRTTPSASLLEHMEGFPGWERIVFLLPGRALAAQAIAEMDPLFRAAEQTMAETDPGKKEAFAAAAEGKAARSWSPIVRASMPSLLRAWVPADAERARFGMLVAAVKLEQASVRDHKYPPALADLPVDPFAYPAKLHYQPTPDGRGYKVWSVGLDRKDQRGEAAGNADLVLERKR